jgi:hypothetical protein
MMRPMHRMHRLETLALILALSAAAPADAEWQIDMQVHEDGGSAQAGRIYLDGDNLRLEMDDAAAGAIVYRGDGPTLLHVDPSSKTYVVMDRATAEQVGGEIESARRAMELQLAALPPEQRAALQRMMPTPPTSESRPDVEVVETDRTRRVDGHACRVRELRRGGEPTGELCVVDWKTAGIGRSDLRAFRDMARFRQELLRQAAGPFASALASQPFDAFEKLDGYPVESRNLGAHASRTTMSLPRKQDTDAGRYRAPEGYRQRSLMPGR